MTISSVILGQLTTVLPEQLSCTFSYPQLTQLSQTIYSPLIWAYSVCDWSRPGSQAGLTHGNPPISASQVLAYRHELHTWFEVLSYSATSTNVRTPYCTAGKKQLPLVVLGRPCSKCIRLASVSTLALHTCGFPTVLRNQMISGNTVNREPGKDSSSAQS